MEISREQLERFRGLYLEKFGITLSPQETLEKAIVLLSLMKIVFQPMKEGDFQRVQERKRFLFNN